jgi:hypothetical protein
LSQQRAGIADHSMIDRVDHQQGIPVCLLRRIASHIDQ